MTILLDGNLLIALAFREHEHSSRARPWFAAVADTFATCPITQGTLVRFLLREGSNLSTAKAVLASFTDKANHVFWPDSIDYRDVPVQGVLGHRQVTDAYLAQLARSHQGRLATFDEGLAALHADVADFIKD